MKNTNKNHKKRRKKRPAKMVFDSMAAAAGALDVPVDVLQRLKDAGCTAFRSGRVYAAEIAPYLRGMPPTPDDDTRGALERRRLRAICEKLEFEFAVSRKEWLNVAELHATYGAKITRFQAIMRQRFMNELPPKLYGMQIPEMMDLMEGAIGECINALRMDKPSEEK